MTNKENILVIGAAGQIGSELTLALRNIYGGGNVFATDIKEGNSEIMDSGPFELLDVMDDKRFIHFVIRHKITQIYNLAAVLSANAEKLPVKAWKINMDALMNMLELAKEVDIKKLFWPSSIAVFGPTSPKINTPQKCIMEPATAYGISKLAGESWCKYFYKKFNVDVRSIRYPGLISYKTQPGGGTTDFAVEMFYEAIEHNKYECFLKQNTSLPFLFMDDAIAATIDLMEAPAKNLSIRSSYNIDTISATPENFATEIKKQIPDFKITYQPDFHQQIADTWPQSIDGSIAKQDWNSEFVFDLKKIANIMLMEIKKKVAENKY